VYCCTNKFQCPIQLGSSLHNYICIDILLIVIFCGGNDKFWCLFLIIEFCAFQQ
jgi:hypothetical protein